jgi:pimeloyl-ACP methyl ester carboxylesterase
MVDVTTDAVGRVQSGNRGGASAWRPYPRSVTDDGPAGYTVTVDPGDRIHFQDWGGTTAGTDTPGIVLVHGLSGSAWVWAPVARRLAATDLHTVAMDLRGHGLSDAPTEDGAYDLAVLADDVVAVAEGSGILDPADASARVVLAGHGFGAIVAATAAASLPMDGRCAGLVLVDGGWESIEDATGLDVDEFLRGLDEPPEVMASMSAYLRDRRAFDPGTWDDDQERAARSQVVETHAGRVVPATRPHALEACVRSMYAYRPSATLPAVGAPVVALVGGDDDERSRTAALAQMSQLRVGASRSPIRTVRAEAPGHNLMRYRPDDVIDAIVSLTD